MITVLVLGGKLSSSTPANASAHTHASDLTLDIFARLYLTWHGGKEGGDGGTKAEDSTVKNGSREKDPDMTAVYNEARDLQGDATCLLRPRCCWHVGRVLAIPVGFNTAQKPRNNQVSKTIWLTSTKLDSPPAAAEVSTSQRLYQ